MKSIARYTLLLLLLFVFASTAAWADMVVVGQLNLLPTPNPGQYDSLQLMNLTGGLGALGAPYVD